MWTLERVILRSAEDLDEKIAKTTSVSVQNHSSERRGPHFVGFSGCETVIEWERFTVTAQVIAFEHGLGEVGNVSR